MESFYKNKHPALNVIGMLNCSLTPDAWASSSDTSTLGPGILRTSGRIFRRTTEVKFLKISSLLLIYIADFPSEV